MELDAHIGGSHVFNIYGIRMLPMFTLHGVLVVERAVVVEYFTNRYNWLCDSVGRPSLAGAIFSDEK